MPTLSRRCSPPESVNGSAAARWDRCRRSSIRVARSVASGPGTPAPTRPCRTSSITRPVTNWCSGFWNTTPKVLATSGDDQRHGSTRSRSDPEPIRTVPPEGSRSPARQASRVDLPEPGAPVTATTSAAQTVRSVGGNRSATTRSVATITTPPGSATGVRLGRWVWSSQTRAAESGRPAKCAVRPAGSRLSTESRSASSTRSARDSQASTRCSTTTTVQPWAVRTASTAASTAAAEAGSRLAVGSSRRSRCGTATVAAATASSCCWPPLSLEVSRARGTPNPTAPSASATSDQICATGTAAFSNGNATSSPTRSITMLPSGSCWTSPIRADEPSPPGPSTRRLPVSPPSGNVPASAASSVDLPDPEAPIRITRSPGSIVNDTSDSATADRPGYWYPHPSAVIRAPAAPPMEFGP